MKKTLFAIFLLALISLSSCSQQDESGVLRNPYLGQKPPGITPEVFAPDIVSTIAHEFSCSFTPDGKEFYFTRRDSALNQIVVMVTQLRDGVWTKPEIAPFVEKQMSFEPMVTADNKRIYFQSGKPIPGQTGPPMNVLYVEREGDGWSSPKNPGPPLNPAKAMYVSTTLDGTIYTTDISNGPGREFLAVSRMAEGKYQKLEKLSAPIDTAAHNMYPFIAPDESYLIYTTRRPSEQISGFLMVMFKNTDGSWSEPEELDIGMIAALPYVSYDGKFLFFTSGEPGKSDIYWVSAKIIEELRPENLTNQN